MAKISDEFTAAGQPTLDEIRALADQGYKSLMINRPDGETPDQPAHSEEREAAESVGLEFSVVPLVPGQLSADLIEQFKSEYDRLPKPIYAHCKMGPRSAMLWALGQAGKQPGDAIVKQAADAGFDVSMLRAHLGA